MRPKDLAGVVLRNHKGEILLLHRNTPHCEQWELPGGKREDNETLEQAAIREAKEELGIIVSIKETIGSAAFFMHDTHWNYTWFEANSTQLPRVIETKTFDMLEYWDLSSLRTTQEALSPNLKNLISVL